MSSQILNPEPAGGEREPVELSGALLSALQAPGSGGIAAADPLVSALHSVDPRDIAGDESRIAFWLNVYNSLLLHRLATRPARGNMALKPRLFSRTAYRVGAEVWSLNDIEHGVLRRNARAPLALRRQFRSTDPRFAALPSRLDPRIHFALNCGARSCPRIRVYDPAGLEADLEAATVAYVVAESELDAERGSVRLPGLMRLYRSDFGDRDEQLRFASARMPALESLLGRDDGPSVSYSRFDWTAVPAVATTGS